MLSLNPKVPAAGRFENHRCDRTLSSTLKGDLRRAGLRFVGSRARRHPVAGSLNAALGEWLIGTGRAPDSYIAAQGAAMGGEAGSMSPRLMARSGPGGETVTGVTGTVHL